MLKPLNIIVVALLVFGSSCSGPRLGGLVERSAFSSKVKTAVGLTYVRSLRLSFPGTGASTKPSYVLALPTEALLAVDADRGRAGLFDLDGKFLDYLEAPGAFSPGAAALGPGMSVFLLDSRSGAISRFDATGRLAGLVFENYGGPSLVDICFDKAGVAYISDQEEDKIHVLHDDVWAESGLGGFGSGVGMFMDPAGLDIDERNRLYVCDSGNSRIQVLDQWGGVTAVWPLKGEECASRPRYISLDRWGNAFVTDAGCKCLRVLNAGGGETFRLEGAGPGLDFIERPEGLDVLDGRLYVADPIDGAIQVFDIRYDM